MNRWLVFLVGLACGAAAMAIPRGTVALHKAIHGGHHGHGAADAERVHTEERFSFMAQGPMSIVAPLFGADKERVWAPGWDPKFIYPLPAADVQGMVFEVAHSHLKATWVNTQLDWKTGRVQYVYVIPDALVTVISLQLTAAGDSTRVDVEYDRTALNAEADEHVRHMAEGDRGSGPEWEKQVNEYLRQAASHP